MMEYIMLLQKIIQGYAFEVVKNRLEGCNSLISDEDGVSIILCDRNFPENVAWKPQIGC